jgi:slit 2
VCDCRLLWLGDFLRRNPVETSGARCDAPKKLQRRRLETMHQDKMKCQFFVSAFSLLLFSITQC